MRETIEVPKRTTTKRVMRGESLMSQESEFFCVRSQSLSVT